MIDGIVYQQRRGQARLPQRKAQRNALFAPPRAVVEHVFGALKHRMGMRRVRYRGLERNALDFALTVAVANNRRIMSLAET